jgi:hypothetical protein
MVDRISQLETQLKLLYGQLYGLETTKITSADEEKVRLQQRIDAKWKEIREKDGEYVRALSQQIKRQDLPDDVAQIVVGEFVDQIELIQPHDEAMKLMLQQILEELRQGTPAAAKLKVAIPLVPGIVAIELEGDAESIVRRLFPTFVKIHEKLKSLADENKPKKQFPLI